MEVQNITSIPNSTSFCKAVKQNEHENIHVHENVEKIKQKLLCNFYMTGWEVSFHP